MPYAGGDSPSVVSELLHAALDCRHWIVLDTASLKGSFRFAQ
jgi:hypothetical protein